MQLAFGIHPSAPQHSPRLLFGGHTSPPIIPAAFHGALGAPHPPLTALGLVSSGLPLAAGIVAWAACAAPVGSQYLIYNCARNQNAVKAGGWAGCRFGGGTLSSSCRRKTSRRRPTPSSAGAHYIFNPEASDPLHHQCEGAEEAPRHALRDSVLCA